MTDERTEDGKWTGGSGGPGGPGGPGGQDDQQSAWVICIQKIYGFDGLNHQIIKKS